MFLNRLPHNSKNWVRKKGSSRLIKFVLKMTSSKFKRNKENIEATGQGQPLKLIHGKDININSSWRRPICRWKKLWEEKNNYDQIWVLKYVGSSYKWSMKRIQKYDTERPITMDKYSQMKRFNYDCQLQVFMYDFMYIDTETMSM